MGGEEILVVWYWRMDWRFWCDVILFRGSGSLVGLLLTHELFWRI
jgi:hypothetical protein